MSKTGSVVNGAASGIRSRTFHSHWKEVNPLRHATDHEERMKKLDDEFFAIRRQRAAFDKRVRNGGKVWSHDGTLLFAHGRDLRK